ncbi:hypothetical protein [Bradyrhizobium sp. RDI18]|uniref:hypothetical protein n=1 Tax=Bradyrhizobium sp. RDI18 TaxID=3367400 RepID=UPI003710109F
MAILRARTACSRELFGYKGIDERAVERLDALGADFEPAGELHARHAQGVVYGLGPTFGGMRNRWLV